MCDSSTDQSELNDLIETISIEDTKDIIFDGLKAAELLTNTISKMVYQEEKMVIRAKFHEILMATKGILEASKTRCFRIARQQGKKDKTLIPIARRLMTELTNLEKLVSSTDIKEMK